MSLQRRSNSRLHRFNWLNTLRVIEALGEKRFRVVALGAGRNIELLAQQIARQSHRIGLGGVGGSRT